MAFIAVPEPLLSTGLESKIDQLTLDHLGYTASSSHFLSSNTTTITSNPPSTTTSPNPENASSIKRGTAPLKYLEELANLFSEEMPAENFYLLRAISSVVTFFLPSFTLASWVKEVSTDV